MGRARLRQQPARQHWSARKEEEETSLPRDPCSHSKTHPVRLCKAHVNAANINLQVKVNFAHNYTNLKLVDWIEFTAEFEEVWRDRMFWRIYNRYSNVRNYLGANYSSLLSTPRISDELTKDGKILFDDLSRNSQFFLTSHEFLSFLNTVRKSEVSFPLNLHLTKEAQTYNHESEFSDDCIADLNELLAKFDDIFGKKIRELEEVWP